MSVQTSFAAIPQSQEIDSTPTISQGRLPGFSVSPFWDEQVTTYTFSPEVKIQINAPAAAEFDLRKPTKLIFYTLPNGNTTAQTIGKKMAQGTDWHFDIQHIGAQTRRLREVVQDENFVVAYLETNGRSWPSWRQKHSNNGELIKAIIQSVKEHVPVPNLTICLSSHSGGGSFIFGYLENVEQIPDEVQRISFLDSNYNYSDEAKHGDKLIAWLKRSSEHYLSVICYDDRNVKFQGKLIVGPTGGTYRKTYKMIDRLKKDMDLVESKQKDYTVFKGLNGRVEIIVLDNPTNAILHTVLVGDKNGLIQAMTSGTKYENKAAIFSGGIAYSKWIQPY